jgi:photosynthetic reaction center cytochrome c subunit
MKLGSRRTIQVCTGTGLAWLVGVALAIGQAGPGAKPQMAEEVFKNVQVLRGIPVDQFMGTMGVFSAALGLSCEDCHEANDSNWANYALDTGMKKRTARRMVLMVSAINRDSFGGRQVVTCYTCHRGSTSPRVTPSLAALYAASPSDESSDDVIAPAPGAPAAGLVLDKYIQALGGADRLASLSSFVAKGTSIGYGPEGQKRPVEIFAKAPGQRTTIIHTLDGDSTTVYDGRAGWIAAPHRPVPVLALTGGDLDGVKLEAEVFFPARIKQALVNWRVGFPTEIDDRPVQVVQGTSLGGALATLYFDRESGLLVRLLHYADSPVGRMPTQVDYADYRDVSGVKLPFRWKVTWLDGVETVELTDLQPNVPIDAARFARPAASAK